MFILLFFVDVIDASYFTLKYQDALLSIDKKGK